MRKRCRLGQEHGFPLRLPRNRLPMRGLSLATEASLFLGPRGINCTDAISCSINAGAANVPQSTNKRNWHVTRRIWNPAIKPADIDRILTSYFSQIGVR